MLMMSDDAKMKGTECDSPPEVVFEEAWEHKH
jgi:hypothetical protein